MDINQLQRIIRKLVNDDNAYNWLISHDRQKFCKELLGQLDEHEVVLSIIEEVISELLARRAEDKFASYSKGDGVSILENGHSIPATIVDQSHNEETLTVQLDKIFEDGHFEIDPLGETVVFQRRRDRVYIHTEGRKLSRLILGRRYQDNRLANLQKRLNVHTRKAV